MRGENRAQRLPALGARRRVQFFGDSHFFGRNLRKPTEELQITEESRAAPRATTLGSVDFLGPTLGVLQLFQPALSARAAPGALEAALRTCLRRALVTAIAEQGVTGDDVAVAVVNRVPPGEATTRFGLVARETAPATAMAQHLAECQVVDPEQIDIDRLCADFGTAFDTEIHREAGRPGSVLFGSFVVAELASRGERGPEPYDLPPDIATMSASNLQTLPLTPPPVHRGEIDDVERMLAQHPIAVISGGAGAGKSVIARMIATRCQEQGDRRLIWWLNAGSRDTLRASCDALLRELGMPPADDAIDRVRNLLARHDGWFVVLDNAASESIVSEVLPGTTRAGSALVTTRHGALLPGTTSVHLGEAAFETMREIARSLLPGGIPETEIDELATACAGHPLAIATTCQYIATTGAPVSELVLLLRTEPEVVLATSVGSHYGTSFDEVIGRAMSAVTDESALLVLTVVAIGGGVGIPRDLFAAVSTSLTARDLHAAIGRLRGLGLVDASATEVACHALVGALVSERLREPVAVVADRMLRAIAARASGAGPSGIRGLVSLVGPASDRVEGAGSQLAARLALIHELTRYGFTATAREQVAAARSLEQGLDARDAGRLALAEAQVALAAGAYETARIAAERGLALAERTRWDRLRAACFVALAWRHECLGEHAEALRAAEQAAHHAPEDPDARALHASFAVSTLPVTRQLPALVALAEDSSLEPALRASFFGKASRAATVLGRHRDAIKHGRRALELDRAAEGERSQVVARDLNDLGMALVDADELDEAETVLRESIAIYEEEVAQHPLGVLPRTHLGRLLVKRAWQTGAPDLGILREAREVLEPAVAVQERTAPDSPDFAALLVGLADALPPGSDDARAVGLLTRALGIDLAQLGADDVEVGIDVMRLMERHLFGGDAAAALRALDVVRSALPQWEMSRPVVAAQLLTFQALALCRGDRPGPLGLSELRTVSARLTRLRADRASAPRIGCCSTTHGARSQVCWWAPRGCSSMAELLLQSPGILTQIASHASTHEIPGQTGDFLVSALDAVSTRTPQIHDAACFLLALDHFPMSSSAQSWRSSGQPVGR